MNTYDTGQHKTFYEKDLEDYIYSSSLFDLGKKGLQIFSRDLQGKSLVSRYYKRQLNLGQYGVADLVRISKGDCNDFDWEVHVIELKRRSIDYRALNQSIRYMEGLRVYFDQFHTSNYISSYHSSLIGSYVDENISIDLLENVAMDKPFFFDINTYNLDSGEILFKRCRIDNKLFKSKNNEIENFLSVKMAHSITDKEISGE